MLEMMDGGSVLSIGSMPQEERKVAVAVSNTIALATRIHGRFGDIPERIETLCCTEPRHVELSVIATKTGRA
jgi:hypothetical protein